MKSTRAVAIVQRAAKWRTALAELTTPASSQSINMLSYEIEAMLNLSDMSPGNSRSVGARSFGDRSVTLKVRHRSSFDGADAARRAAAEEDELATAEDVLDVEPGCAHKQELEHPESATCPRHKPVPRPVCRVPQST